MLLARLLFFSRRAWDAKGGVDSDQVLASILAAGRRNNPVDGVSGVLIVDDDLFVQVLEGPKSALTKTFRKIAMDPRHKDVVLAGMVEAGSRLYEGWNVCVRRAPGSSARPAWFACPDVTTFEAFNIGVGRLLLAEGGTHTLVDGSSKISLDIPVP